MSEYERVMKCVSKHCDDFIEKHDKMIKDWYITEENRTTVRGKYFNLIYVMNDHNYSDIAKVLINHCCNNHM